jgi:hypothetical protein
MGLAKDGFRLLRINGRAKRPERVLFFVPNSRQFFEVVRFRQQISRHFLKRSAKRRSSQCSAKRAHTCA